MTQTKIQHALKVASESITVLRQWFAVYRVLADRKIIREGDYMGFLNYLSEMMGEAAPNVAIAELRRMDVQSFSKPVAKWDINNAPVSEKRFKDYLALANLFDGALN